MAKGYVGKMSFVKALVGSLIGLSSLSSFAVDCTKSDKVLAFYYGWYANPPFDAGDWQKFKNILGDEPQIGSYASESEANIRTHVAEAKAHGVDGFIISWVGSHSDFGANKSEMVLGSMLDIAASQGFCVAIDFEPLFMKQRFGLSNAAIGEQMKYVLRTHGSHPNFLKIQGKPAIFFWKNEVPAFAGNFWGQLKREINSSAYWISEAGGSKEGITLALSGVFDNAHFYSSWWPSYQSEQKNMWTRLSGRPTFATVAPGYNDGNKKYGRWVSNSHTNYLDQWKFVHANPSDYVLITSYNEWAEGTYIESSSLFSDLYLRITRDGAKHYHSSRP